MEEAEAEDMAEGVMAEAEVMAEGVMATEVTGAGTAVAMEEEVMRAGTAEVMMVIGIITVGGTIMVGAMATTMAGTQATTAATTTLTTTHITIHTIMKTATQITTTTRAETE